MNSITECRSTAGQWTRDLGPWSNWSQGPAVWFRFGGARICAAGRINNTSPKICTADRINNTSRGRAGPGYYNGIHHNDYWEYAAELWHRQPQPRCQKTAGIKQHNDPVTV